MKQLNTFVKTAMAKITMKRTLYLLIFFGIFITNQMYGQDDSTTVGVKPYIPFPSSNAMWREGVGGFQCGCCSEFQYRITGDTIINDLTYHKLQKSGARYYDDTGWGWCSSKVIYTFNYYSGCFRNDSSTRKVYYKGGDGNPEKLWYDFSLSVGDTIPFPHFFDEAILIIQNIDSVIIGENYHQRFHINSISGYCRFEIIEGIGSTFGLFPATVCPFESQSDLRCFSIDGHRIYPSWSLENDCDLVTNIREIKEHSLLFYPNPVTNQLHIQNNEFNITHIQIFDITGRTMMAITPQNESEIVLNLKSLHAGIYFVRATLNGNYVTEKIIKQ